MAVLRCFTTRKTSTGYAVPRSGSDVSKFTKMGEYIVERQILHLQSNIYVQEHNRSGMFTMPLQGVHFIQKL